MAKIYTKNTWQDEILSGDERYDILEDGGGAFKSTMRINLSTAVLQAGTAVDATKMNNLENGVDGLDTLLDALLTGWIAGGTWTYASATTFTVAGDLRTILPKGTKIKLTQTTMKYFYVVNVSYSAPNTTVTVTGGSEYSLANAAITNPYYSYDAVPQRFPTWFSHTPVFTGFSADPTCYDRFAINGRVITWYHREQFGTGTSNATGYTITAPVANPSAFLSSSFLCDDGMDAGSPLTAPARIVLSANSTTVTAYKTIPTGAWTNSGEKHVTFTISYEI